MKRQTNALRFILGAILLWVIEPASLMAKANLKSIFTDHMVFQRNVKFPVWGTAQPNERVIVEFNGQKAETLANAKGEWRVELGPFPAGGPHEMTITSSDRQIVKNILMGDVWLCSGQSNMRFIFKNCSSAAEDGPLANFPEIRMFLVNATTTGPKTGQYTGRWNPCSLQTLESFSAVAYYFAKEIHQSQKVPIGLIDTSQGGSPIESWVSEETLKSDPDFLPILEYYQKSLIGFDERKQAFEKSLKEYQEAISNKVQPPPARPYPPFGPGHVQSPSIFYNSHIQPISPYAIRGVLWYQGEANVSRAYQYQKLFPALIKSWRQMWGMGDFPFLFVQLASVGGRNTNQSSLSELQEAQLMTWKNTPNTGMATAADLGEKADVHPKNKKDVGIRLARTARALVYGEKLVYSGPLYDSMKIENDKVHLSFTHIGGGLIAKGGTLKEFSIAGEDQKFVPALASIVNEKVVVGAESVKNPVAVRYAWDSFPEYTLYNKEELPAPPFRTDNWPGVTWNNKEPTFK